MKKFLLVLLVLTLIGINHVNCRRSGPKSDSIEEEEDFSEFDSMLDEEVQIPLKRNNNEKRKSANDFAEFDVNNKEDGEVEDEDFEEESEDLNYFDTNSDDKPKQDKSAERINSASNENIKRGSSFNNLNVDDLDMEEFEHFIGIYNLKKNELYIFVIFL